MQGRVVSIQVGRVQAMASSDPGRPAWNSGIIKTAAAGDIEVRELGLVGDEQADIVHHGGSDKAILGYAIDHYPVWNAEHPDAGFAPGGFGENLTIAGQDESTCCIGDIYRIGTCLLQISQPRQPCWKLSRRWGLPQLAADVQRSGRTGWYFRVLQQGHIAAGQNIELVDRPHADISVTWASRVMHSKPHDLASDKILCDCAALSESWKLTLAKRIGGHALNDEPRLLGPNH